MVTGEWNYYMQPVNELLRRNYLNVKWQIVCVKRKIFFLTLPKHFQGRGGWKLNMYYTQTLKKTTNYLYYFQFGTSLGGKNLKIIFQGQILVFGGQFSIREKQKFCLFLFYRKTFMAYFKIFKNRILMEENFKKFPGFQVNKIISIQRKNYWFQF